MNNYPWGYPTGYYGIQERRMCSADTRGTASYEREHGERIPEAKKKYTPHRRAANSAIHCKKKTNNCFNAKRWKKIYGKK